MPPKTSPLRCRCRNWLRLPSMRNPPVENSIQLLKVSLPPSNICTWVSGGAVAAGGALVSSAEKADTAAQAPSIVAQHHRIRPIGNGLLDFIGFRVAG